jgi:hypothetical protein
VCRGMPFRPCYPRVDLHRRPDLCYFCVGWPHSFEQWARPWLCGTSAESRTPRRDGLSGVSQVVPTVRRPTMAMSSTSRGEASALADMVTTTQARVGRLLTDPNGPHVVMLLGAGVPEGQVPPPRPQLLHVTTLRTA